MQVAADGSAIAGGEYFGGSTYDHALGVSTDGQGGYLVTGATYSADFPVTAGVFQDRLLGEINGWVARLRPDLSVHYTTYLGGALRDSLVGVTGDADGRAYVVGLTLSGDLPATIDGFQDVSAGHSASFIGGAGREFHHDASDTPQEAFFGVLDAAGTRVEYGTYLGSYLTAPRGDLPFNAGQAIARSARGDVVVGGITQTVSFPVIRGGLSDSFGGINDGFFVHITPQDLAVSNPTVLPDARVETAYDYQLEALGGTAPYHWELAGFALPDGLSLSSSGRISGSALLLQNEYQGHQFTARVTDALGRTAHKSLMLNVRFEGGAVCTPNRCTFTAPLGLQFTLPVPFPARAVGPFGVFISGTPPPGMSMDYQKGVLDGSATAPGDYDFAFMLTDAHTLMARHGHGVAAAAAAATRAGADSSAAFRQPELRRRWRRRDLARRDRRAVARPRVADPRALLREDDELAVVTLHLPRAGVADRQGRFGPVASVARRIDERWRARAYPLARHDCTSLRRIGSVELTLRRGARGADF